MAAKKPLPKDDKAFVKEWLAAGNILDALFRICPQWVQNLFSLVGKSISKAHNFPNSGKFTPAMIGTLAGQALSSAELFLKKRDAEKTASPQVKKYLRQLRKSYRNFRPALLLFEQKLNSRSEVFSLDGKSAFSAAKSKAIDKNLKVAEGSSFFENEATRIYVVLLCLFPTMNQVKSVRQLHEILCRIMGEAVVGDIKRIEGICRKIKLSFAKPGRPKKEVPASP